MQWFRAKRSPSGYAALFALALQLALSFGHLHLDELALGKTAPAAAAVANASDSQTPPGTVPDRDEVCAICAIISLSGALLIPDAPMLVFAGAPQEAFFQNLVAVLVSDLTRGQFQARAPPA
jgi:hypothetical protein